MKRINYIAYALWSLSLLSCNAFLDVEPRQSISDEATITNGTSAATAVRGMYRNLASGNYYGTTFQSIGYLSGDNIEWTGSQAIAGQFVNHEVRSDNASVAAVWAAIYSTINQANHIIEKVAALPLEPSFSQETKDQYLGEAYFVRALCYFDLVRLWGGVPIYLQPTATATDNRGRPRSSVDETYAQVLSDLEQAEALLPETTNRIRATRKTAWALKARYYLYRGNWEQAEVYASRIIANQANYQLLQPYGAFFQNNVVATAESVFELSYSPTNTNGHRNNWQPPQNGGTRQWAPNSEFVALVTDPEIGGNRNVLVASTADGRWYGNLYYRSPATDPAYVIRMAELYLTRAEARARQGGADKLAGAKDDLQAVRSRAGLGPAGASTQDELLLAIENERRMEFAFEPHRWFDLVRTGRAAAVLGLTDSRRYVLPIPSDQLRVDDALTQNEGYN